MPVSFLTHLYTTRCICTASIDILHSEDMGIKYLYLIDLYSFHLYNFPNLTLNTFLKFICGLHSYLFSFHFTISCSKKVLETPHFTEFQGLNLSVLFPIFPPARKYNGHTVLLQEEFHSDNTDIPL